MRVLRFLSIALGGLLSCLYPHSAVPITWYVDGGVSESGGGQSREGAFRKIQEGIDAASDGDTVIVAEGIYVESIHFGGKNIVLRSTDPFDRAIMANTVIDGNHSYRVVNLSGTEDETCVVSGFTIRNGGGVCGGDSENHSRATIQSNAITDNNAAQGAGIAYCDGVIQNNLIRNNESWSGAGGLHDCDGVIQNNVIIGNGSFADDAAGGLTHCSGLIQNNVIVGNSSSSMNSSGGGLAYCHGTIQNNTISGNSSNAEGGGGLDHCNGTIQNNAVTANHAMHGGGIARCHGTIQGNTVSENEFGGLYECQGVIQNNTVAGNSGDGVFNCGGIIQNNTIAENSGWGLRGCEGTIVNCIVWGNTQGRVDQVFETSDPVYSCIEHWAGGGEGNISFYPHFVDPDARDYHLQTWSPCIDAGYPGSSFSREPQPNGGRINMGSYGNTPEAASKSPDADADGLPDDWELHAFGNLDADAFDDPDGDHVPNITEYRYGWNPTAAPENLVENLTKGKWYPVIQVALDEAEDGDEIVVYPGTYRENINFFGKNVLLRSTDPWDVGVVASTIIDGNEAGSVVTFSGTETGDCFLSGFTIRKGYGGSWPAAGGGICGGTRTNHSRATIENNVLADNNASEGGGIAFCDGVILNNAITGNQAGGGGGIAYCDGAIVNNTISENSATIGGGLSGCGGLIGDNVISGNFGHGGGGGLSGCGGIIQNNLITKNWTEQDESRGGGLWGCNGTIRHNVISNNRSRCHGAGGLSGCNGVIENNLIIGNSSTGGGGGLSDCNGTIVNNTIAENEGSGLWSCTGTIRNCIIWGNAPTNQPQLSQSSQPTYCCVQNWVGGGEGNIGLNPHFVDPENGDFQLQSWSPCIDSGDPSSNYFDEPQPTGLRIDMGAYGNTPEATSKSPDTDSDGLPDDWELRWFGNLGLDAASDPDGDHIDNLTEYHHGWSPNMPSVTLAENMTKNLRYETIQAAICESTDGDEIIVHTGVYKENINFFGKNVMLRSIEPSDPGAVANTILDGSKSGSAVTFSGTENETCVLSGFTIRNGNAFYGGGICGGSFDSATHAAIQNCVIVGNSADQGGGIACCDGIIENNLIYGNSAGYGGGVRYCHGIIRNCTISNNSSSWGGGLHDCEGTILNCIIWGNIADQDPQIYHSSEPTYSCIQDWTGTGEGNITTCPYFVSPEEGDYHLESWSPCIDSGDPSSDFSNEPEPNGGRVDMGAYGNTSQAVPRSADTDSDGLPDDWELRWFATLDLGADSDPDGDQIPNSEEYRHGWSPTSKAGSLVENLTSGAFYQTIQDALDESADRDEIVVYPGLYEENIFFGDKNVVLRSIMPLNADIVANTIIDGRGIAPVVVFGGTGGWTCVLSGFTIRNGKASYGGGGISGWGTHATVQNCVITGNSAGWEGGGLFRFHGTIENNLIIGNSAPDGGGLRNCEGTIRNNTIVNNSADWGSGLSGCYAAIRNCIVWGNVGTQSGQIAFSREPFYSCVEGWTGGGEGNIAEAPLFVDPANGNFRLLPSSPCIDAGDNAAANPGDSDLAGMHRVMYGGKSLTVDMGACEYYVNQLQTDDVAGTVTLTWSSLGNKSYSIFYSDDLVAWRLADENVLSDGYATTSWIDDGSKTGTPLSAAVRRFFRVVENP